METDIAAPPSAAPWQQDDLLWRQLKTIPAFRALLRAVESRFYFSIDLPSPVLDVGCGDGHFSQMTFSAPITAGIDPWWNPLQKSRRSGMYDVLAQAMGHTLPFPDEQFASAFSNSVLEHIPGIQPVLVEVNRVLQPHGRFLMTMPSHYFNEWLGGAAFFENLGAAGMAGRYRRLFERITRHEHTDPPDVWANRLAQAGFEIERWQYYFSPQALRALEIGHLQGVPAAIMHALTGHWIVAPWESSLRWTERWLRPFYEEEFGDAGAYLLIVARKVSRGPVSAPLPPPRPFTLAELEANLPGRPARPPSPPAAEQLPPATASPSATEPETAVTPKPDRLNLALLTLSLLLAMAGQQGLSQSAGTAVAGVRWYALAAIPLLLLVWRRRGGRPADLVARLPAWHEVPPARLWLLPALLLALLASRFTAVPGLERPYLALGLWLAAIGLGFLALAGAADDQPAALRASRFTWVAAGLLFGTSLLLRLYQLDQLPFLLSGSEANLGLNAVQILQGQIRNPFGTAWLTNPTLPLYLLALPIHFLGQTVTAVRLAAPFAGSLTVVALFLIGQQLYGRGVGLGAAILLLGAHLHLHYSRLGLTNIWDPLLVLLALGLAAIAWERNANAPRQRVLWLGAGLAMGLGAYGFASARLLPLILLPLIGLAWLWERPRWRQQGGHLLAAAALAILVALPAFAYYRQTPALFLERARALSVFGGEAANFQQQAANAGQSMGQKWPQQVWQAALAFHGREDLSPLYHPRAPLLNFGTAVLFSLGFILALLRLRRLKFSLLLVWLLATLFFGGVLLIDPPQSHRLLVAAPAVMLLAALALGELAAAAGQALWPELTGAGRQLWLVAAVAVVLALSDVGYYYGRYPQENQFADANTEIAYAVTEYLNTLDGEWTAYFYGPPAMYADFPTFTYLLTDFKRGLNFFDVADPLPAVSTPAPNRVFIFVPERFADVTAVQAAYPGGRLQTVNGTYRSPLFQIYAVASP